MPAEKRALLVAPPLPEIGVGPAAESVQALGAAVPPLLLVTFLTNVRLGTSSVLTIVQVALSPRPSVMSLPFCVPPTQTQSVSTE